MFSFTRYDAYKTCPRQFYYKYIAKIPIIDPITKSDPRILGTVMHKGIQEGYEIAEDFYKRYFFNLVNDEMINNLIPIKYWSEQLFDVYADWYGEVQVQDDKLMGYVDLYRDGNIVDIKYSKKSEKYLTSPQVMLYQKMMETSHPEETIENLYYLYVPKIDVRQSKKEDIMEFRKRIMSKLEEQEIQLIEVKYDESKVKDIYREIDHIQNMEPLLFNFPRNVCGLCEHWCKYKDQCDRDEFNDVPIMDDVGKYDDEES